MLELLLLTLIAGYAYCLGHCLFPAFGVSYTTLGGRIAARTSLGLGVVAHAILALGLAGYLTREIVLGTGAMGLFFAIGAGWLVKSNGCNRSSSLARRVRVIFSRCTSETITRRASEGRNWLRRGRPVIPISKVRMRQRISSIAQTLLIGVACVGTLTSALAPPTAGDALCYHLEIPKRFVEHQAVEFLPLTDNSLFPFHMEMLYTLALLLGTPVLAQLMHWFVGLLFALSVTELATPMVGSASARWASIVALLVPGVTNQMTAPLNDLTVALYCTLMMSTWIRWQATFSWRWLALSGLWGGFAVGTKLVAAGLVGIVAVATAVVSLRRARAAMHRTESRRRREHNSGCGFNEIGAEQSAMDRATIGCRLVRACKTAGGFAAVVCLVCGIWYARSWYHWGNPVYPYFNSLFGLEPHTRSLLITTRNPVTLLWSATMHPEAYGGRGVQFGAMFLALLPGLVLVRCHPQLRSLLGIAAGSAAIWFAVRQELRFLLPIVAVLSVAAVAVVRGLRYRHPVAYRAAFLCMVCLLGFQGLIVLKRARPCLAVAWGFETRESFLKRHEPSYEVARFVNTQLPSASRLISQDYRGLYFEPDFVREDALRRYWPYAERGDALVDRLGAAGFTHVLLVQSHNPETAVYDAGFVERLGPAVERLRLMLASHFEGPGGDRRDYKLYELPSRGRVSNAGDSVYAPNR